MLVQHFSSAHPGTEFPAEALKPWGEALKFSFVHLAFSVVVFFSQ